MSAPAVLFTATVLMKECETLAAADVESVAMPPPPPPEHRKVAVKQAME